MQRLARPRALFSVCGKCQQPCEELLTRLEAEAVEHAKTKEHVSRAESDAAERSVEVQRLQEQLQQASAKAEAQRSRMFAQMQLLREELQGRSPAEKSVLQQLLA